MLRTLILTLVFTVTAGQHASLLCRTWGAQPRNQVAGCHHDGSAVARVGSAQGRCAEAGGAGWALLRDGGLRGLPSPGAVHPVAQPFWASQDGTPGESPLVRPHAWAGLGLHDPPPLISLRI